ncbi:hypothetical protein FOMPIDRAFT_1104040, partial [Fomitopsis schrenkii]
GDFNIVEEAIDRLPMRDSPAGPREALRDMLTQLHLHDGWRITEPSTRDYTFPQRESATRSRLDRIYLPTELLSRSFEWDISSTVVPTDHRLVSARLTTSSAPFIGKGRWTMPTALLVDQNFLSEAIRLGEVALKAAEECSPADRRSEEHNPQVVLSEYK